MHKNQWNSIGIIWLEEIEPDPCRVASGFESADQYSKRKIGRRFVVADRRGVIDCQRTHFSFNSCCWLLGRATKRERGVLSVKIERGRNRSSDSPGRRELFGWIEDSHADKRTANTMLNVFLLDHFLFDLLFELHGGEVVRRPDRVADGLKSSMISLIVPGEG